ncbi:hypothetical protein AFB00_13860 [Pseudonocardia sp. HH130630-07]|nr:hypothetical protein AFB00_13860 [Pseudonocardia sp. HH130630-07]
MFALDERLVGDLVAGHPWATLCSVVDGVPVVSHLPVLAEPGPAGAVVGHLARADAERHELGAHPAVVVVQGPHAYVSPSFYRSANPAVPTWNFVVAHLHGRPVVLGDAETLDVLDRTVEHLERPRPEPFRLASVDGYARRIAPHTTGFRLVPDRIDAKAKLSQDKPQADRDGVIAGLREDPVHAAPEMADWMSGARP